MNGGYIVKTYEKIETIFARDIEGTKQLIWGKYRNETVRFLKDVPWLWTEKVDGTNIRVCWDGHKVSFGGRTEKASIPAPLVNRLNELFGGEENAQIFEQLYGDREVILFGEGYGKGIQAAGKAYKPDGVDFILFDVMICDNYQSRQTVVETAEAFGIDAVWIVGTGTLEDAVRFVMEHPKSTLGDIEMEGVVCRPEVELRDRCGNRVIVKIKWNDFKCFAEQNERDAT